MNIKKLPLLSIIMAALLVSLGCAVTNFSIDTVTVGELKNESQTVELGDAEQVRVYIKMGVGDLKVDTGTDALMEADFTYNVADWKPEVTYEVIDGNGRLNVRQPRLEQISMRSDARYKWKLAFNEEVPLDMRIEHGAGSGDIDVGDLNVTQLDVKLAAGDFTIDLSGNQSLQHLELDMGAGDVTVDLNGDWKENVNVDYQGGLGQTTLRLPKDIGVYITVNKALGSVNTNGLSKRGDAYVNEAYGKSDITLEINIQAGIGQINLEVVD